MHSATLFGVSVSIAWIADVSATTVTTTASNTGPSNTDGFDGLKLQEHEAQETESTSSGFFDNTIAVSSIFGSLLILLVVFALVALRRRLHKTHDDRVRLQVIKTVQSTVDLQWDHGDNSDIPPQSATGLKIQQSLGSSVADDVYPSPFRGDGIVKGVQWESTGDSIVGGIVTAKLDDGGTFSFSPPLSGHSQAALRDTKFGKIDHLRPWNESNVDPTNDIVMNLQSNSDTLTEADDDSEVVVCHLCEQMGNLVKAVQSCVDCGDVAMCHACLDSIHSQRKNKKHKFIPIISLTRQDSIESSSTSDVQVPTLPASKSRVESRLKTMSTSEVEGIDRLPFKSEIQGIKAHFKKLRHNYDSTAYDFFDSNKAMRSYSSSCILNTSNKDMRSPRISLPTQSTNSEDIEVQQDSEVVDHVLSEVPKHIGSLPTRREVIEARRLAANAERQEARRQNIEERKQRVYQIQNAREAVEIEIERTEDHPDTSVDDYMDDAVYIVQRQNSDDDLSAQFDEGFSTYSDVSDDQSAAVGAVTWFLSELLSLVISVGEQQNEELRQKIMDQHWKLAMLESRRKLAVSMALDSSRQALEALAESCVDENKLATLDDLAMEEESRKISIRKMLATIGKATMPTSVPAQEEQNSPSMTNQEPQQDLEPLPELQESQHVEVPSTQGVVARQSAASPTGPFSPLSPRSDAQMDARQAVLAAIQQRVQNMAVENTVQPVAESPPQSPLSADVRRKSMLSDDISVPVPDIPTFGSVLAELGAKLKTMKRAAMSEVPQGNLNDLE